MKRNRIKGTAALLMTAVMLLAGCGGKEEPKTTAEAETTRETADTQTEAETTTTGSVYDINDYLPEETDNTGIHPALWRAADPASGNSIYLFGTIHLTMNGVSPITDYVADAIDSSDFVTIEFDTSKIATEPDLLRQYQAGLIYSDGSILPEHLSEETYNKIVDFAADRLGGWNDVYDYYNTGFWMSQISGASIISIEGADLQRSTEVCLIEYATEHGKPVQNVETLDECLAYVNAYTDKLADALIPQNLESIDSPDNVAMLADLYSAWASGDLETIEEISDYEQSEIPEELSEDFEKYWDTMYTNRNKYMAERAAAHIKNGDKCLFTVGVAHYAGDTGIISLLEDMGYTVERIDSADLENKIAA